MAILDAKLEICDAKDMTAAAGSAGATGVIVGTNYLNLGTGYNAWGDTIYNPFGRVPMWLNIVCTTATAPLGVNVRFDLMTNSSAAASGDTVCSFYASSTTTPAATGGFPMAAGHTLVRAPVPQGYYLSGVWYNLKQYLYISMQNYGTAITAGNIDAWISLDAESEVPSS
jgi:hypothetical protein